MGDGQVLISYLMVMVGRKKFRNLRVFVVMRYVYCSYHYVKHLFYV
jgi:hypothetical protein